MKELRTEIVIQATPEKVWKILTSLDEYAQWNPFLNNVVGVAQVGEPVELVLKSTPKDMVLHCKVNKVEPNRELRWKYHVVSKILFSGEHSFTIEPIDANHVRFVDREVFNGLLVPLQAKDIDTNTKRGFEAMDKALKAKAEQN